jgi:hypothetical protein
MIAMHSPMIQTNGHSGLDFDQLTVSATQLEPAQDRRWPLRSNGQRWLHSRLIPYRHGPVSTISNAATAERQPQ